MKQIYLFLAAFFVACMSAFADNGITINPSPVQVSPGDQVKVEIEFDNSEGLYKGFQMDLNLPTGVDILTEDVWDDDEEDFIPTMKVENGTLLKSTHTLSFSKVGDGHYRFICVDTQKNAALKSREGTVMAITLVADENLSSGEFEGSFSGIEFNTTSDTAFRPDDVAFKVEIVPTKINGVSTDLQTKSVYNIAGQQLNGAQKGINIVDGKKVMVK